MPLYNITAIVRAGIPQQEVHNLLTGLSKIVLTSNGVVASVSNFGIQDLAYRMRAHQEFHTEGRYMQLRYIMSPKTIVELERTLKLDPRMLRWMTIKERETSLAAVGSLPPQDLVAAATRMMAGLGMPPQEQPPAGYELPPTNTPAPPAPGGY
jgi:small subunit ribosomal protein S6